MSGDRSPHLVSVDWGTTSLRCTLVGPDGAALQQTKAERGILKTDGQPFIDILHGEIRDFLAQFADGKRVPVIMSGMIGSRQGWHEAPYLRCPASPQDLARELFHVDTTGSPLAQCDVRIVPGMDITEDKASGALPDVMRGEETQVIGALLGAKLENGVFVLPGTHSKWVTVEAATIIGFRTFMTGEIYEALLRATILGHLAESADDDTDDGFTLGVRTAMSQADATGPGDLLNMIFSARSRVLHNELAGTAVRNYLSGLLIGAEIRSGVGVHAIGPTGASDQAFNAHIIGDDTLQKRYMQAASIMGGSLQPTIGDPVSRAHLAIAEFAGMLG